MDKRQNIWSGLETKLRREGCYGERKSSVVAGQKPAPHCMPAKSGERVFISPSAGFPPSHSFRGGGGGGVGKKTQLSVFLSFPRALFFTAGGIAQGREIKIRKEGSRKSSGAVAE